jgi:hypothetical protein
MFAAGKTKGVVATAANYIEDVFSTYLYTGNGSTTTINNGIDLAGKGGMTWLKCRNNTFYNSLYDTVRGATKVLYSNDTLAEQTYTGVTSFDSTGFTLGSTAGNNGSPYNFVSWTFRKQPKFFDIVTYTGNSTAGRQVAHNLGSVPGCMIVRDLLGGPWYVYHQSLGNTQTLVLNSSTNAGTDPSWNNTTPTSTVFTLGDNYQVNYTGHDYVAYLFASNAGGFGLTGTDNVISCGSFTSNGSGLATVNLGYEPQWVMVKGSSAVTNWQIVDNMRGFVAGAGSASSRYLNANSSSAELDSPPYGLTSTGFEYNSAPSTTFIYIAIRRGPMKVPTDATKVFAPVAQSGGGTVTTNFPVDLSINRNRGATGANWMDRLRGGSATSYNYLLSTSTAAESTGSGAGLGFDNNTGYIDNGWWSSGQSIIYENFRRAPSFFDEVCYTGDSTNNRQVTHNLGVEPAFVIVKNRSAVKNWIVGGSVLPWSNTAFLNLTDAAFPNSGATYITAGSSTTFTVNDNSNVNNTGNNYVAYLFATCPGVSKVFSFTGNGTTQTINCGFTGGARFVLIKRTDSTGDWYVYDTARGMTTLTDPYLLLNSTAAESATLGSVTTVSTGFAVNASILAAINTNGASYIFLAIA